MYQGTLLYEAVIIEISCPLFHCDLLWPNCFFRVLTAVDNSAESGLPEASDFDFRWDFSSSSLSGQDQSALQNAIRTPVL